MFLPPLFLWLLWDFQASYAYDAMPKKPRFVPIIIAVVLIVYALFFYIPKEQNCTFYSMGGIKTEVKAFYTKRKLFKQTCNTIKTRYEELENAFSKYRAGSELSRINDKASIRPVVISKEMITVIKRSLEIAHLTEGSFDITILPLINLWKESQKNNEIPSQKSVRAALNKVSYKHIKLNEENSTVKFQKKGVKLDLGAIAKGYMIDQAKVIMLKAGIQRGLVNSGGDVIVFDKTDSPKEFSIGIYNPVSKNHDQSYKITNGAIVTSGNYNRYYEIQGQKFSHIIDPRTGQNKRSCFSISVVAPTCTDADAIATALCADQKYKGNKKLPGFKNVEIVDYQANDKD